MRSLRWRYPDEDGRDDQGPASEGPGTSSVAPGVSAVEPRERFGEPFVDIDELARWLATSPRHVRRLVHERRVPFVKIGHYVRFDRADIRAWLELQKVAVTDERASNGEPLWLRPSARLGRERVRAPSSGRRSTESINAEPPWLRVRGG